MFSSPARPLLHSLCMSLLLNLTLGVFPHVVYMSAVFDDLFLSVGDPAESYAYGQSVYHPLLSFCGVPDRAWGFTHPVCLISYIATPGFVGMPRVNGPHGHV